MEKVQSEVERFDELFERIHALAKPEPLGISDITENKRKKQKRKHKKSEHGTRYIKEDRPRKRVVRFMIFNSELKTKEKIKKGKDKRLYGPSMTAFEGKRKLKSVHVKRRDLEMQLTDKDSRQAHERKAELIAALGKIELLFNEFERASE